MRRPADVRTPNQPIGKVHVAHKRFLVLPSHHREIPPSPFPAKEVTKVALRLKYQIEQVISCELEEDKITRANSPVITEKVVKTAKEAGGKDYAACVVFCLLICKKWFKRQAMLELWDADLHDVRAVACEVIAKKLFVNLSPPVCDLY